jgi:hypothetical protein
MQEQCLGSIRVRNGYEFRFLKVEEELNKKNEKAYYDLPVERWGIEGAYDVDEVRRDRRAAYEVMFPGETREVAALQEQFGFVNKQLFDELIQYFDCRSFVQAKRFREMINVKQGSMREALEAMEEIGCQLGELMKLRGGVPHA